MKIAATTISDAPGLIREKAKERAKALAIPYLEREDKLEEMAEKYKAEGFLIYGRRLPSFKTKDGEYHFHLGTSVLRTRQILAGNEDRLCRLLPKEGPCRVLDCTFGHANDSTTISWFLGDRGSVTALEKSTAPYEIGRAGIESYQDKDPALTDAVRRIYLIHADFKEYLKNIPEKSFDVVYFDPMFRHPVQAKVNDMTGFREAAAYDKLDDETILLAMRAARARVIVKERPFSLLFKKDFFTRIEAKKGQTTAYGVIDLS